MQTITMEDAIGIVQKKLAEAPGHNFVVLRDKTREFPFGWVFFYNTRKYLETKNPKDGVPGTAPIVINRDGSLVALPSGQPAEVSIKAYLDQWSRTRERR